MKKYGVEHFHISAIDYASNQDELDYLEYYYINKYKDHCYNTKFDIGKCGGDTLSHNSNIQYIKDKISKSKKYDQNPNSTCIKMINIQNNHAEIFKSMKECQDKYNIPRHDIIIRRCLGQIKKPYRNQYMFEYL